MKLRTMKRNSQFPSSLAAACGVVLMLCAAQAGLAQQNAKDKPVSAAPAAEEKEGTAPAKPGSEGIKVHGHWIIDVRNRDGSLAQHRDFENSLADGGYFLTGVASGYMLPGAYYIALVGNACPPTFGKTNCYIPQTGSSTFEVCANLTCVGGLTVVPNFTGTGTPAYSIVLSGSATMPLAGTISAVQTLYSICYNLNMVTGTVLGALLTASPAYCVTGSGDGGNSDIFGWGAFTGTTLATPLAVTAGQIVQVTVTISFS